MTLTRYQIRNEYGLADKELYQAADKEDPEALLEGVSMAGLVGVLRQLGDLAEFAAEVFHCLHEEMMTTAARGHGLAMRLQQLEAEFPSIEIPILSQTDHSTFYYDTGLEWHSNLQTKEDLLSPRNLPHCIMDLYEECRGPPQLFLLDKFDVAGSGSCLKRYSDPSLLKSLTASAVIETSKLIKDEGPRKSKKKRSHTISKETPGNSRKSHAKLHQLFFLEHVENGQGNPEFHVKLKRRQLNGPLINSSSRTGYMEKFLKNSSPYCERVHGNLDQSSPAMETEVTVCSVLAELPISSLVYPNNGDSRKYNEMEIESTADDERLGTLVNGKSLTNIEGGQICLERRSSVNSCCKANNETDAPAFMVSEAKEADSDDRAICDLGFPLSGQTQICTNAEVTQTEVLAQVSSVLHHSPKEGESSLLCTDIERSSLEDNPYKAEQAPFSFSCYENPANFAEDSRSRLELRYNKANADEIGLKSSEACEVFEGGRDPMLNISPETHPEYLSKLTQVPHYASDGGTNVDHSQQLFSVDTGSEISLSALVEDQFSSITNQEVEALEPEDISSEAGHSIPDSKSSLKETPSALESDSLLPNPYISKFDDLEDETNSQDRSSMNPKQSKHISTSETSSENGTLMSDTPRDLHTGCGNLSASSCQEDALANPDLAKISSHSGQEDPQTMSIVADDSSEPEVPIPDTPRLGTCFAGDVGHDIHTGLNNKAETVPEIDLETFNEPQESLLGTEECLSPECCLQTQNPGKESPSETGSENPIIASVESLPTQNGPVGDQGSPLEEALTCNVKLFPSSITEIEALHAPHQETFTSLNDHTSMLPFSMSFHETAQADPEITPPLPPLPPTQWWIGKLVESTEMPSLAGSENNSFSIHMDENTQNGSVQATKAQYPSEASTTDGENHNSYVYREDSIVVSVSVCEQTTMNEPSKAAEEQSPSAVNGTSDIYMHTDESTLKCLNKTVEAPFAEEVSVGGLEADWRAEAMALEWFSQNLTAHSNPHSAKLEEEPPVDHPQEATREILQDNNNNSFDQNQKAKKPKRENDALVIGIDRSMLRKVSEQNRTQVVARVDENDSLLQMIRSKSFNLRPADTSVRPNFQVAVPKTNLKVAAILEKANTLRQAMAGSDDEQDSDSWSE